MEHEQIHACPMPRPGMRCDMIAGRGTAANHTESLSRAIA